jgi:hypothetical protein
MGVLARVAGISTRGTVMTANQMQQRRRAWRSMSAQNKHERLQSMRQQQQRQVEFEMLRLTAHVR